MIAIIGVGAIGSWLTLYLARPAPEYKMLLWDDDRVGMENIGNSAFLSHHVGGFKAVVGSELAALKGGYARFVTDTLDERTVARLVKYSPSLVVDCLDNAESRALLHCLRWPCTVRPRHVSTLHIGISEHGNGSVLWDEVWTVPDEGYARGGNPICTHQLGRPIIRMAAVVAAKIIEDFIETGERRSQLFTTRRAL